MKEVGKEGSESGLHSRRNVEAGSHEGPPATLTLP